MITTEKLHSPPRIQNHRTQNDNLELLITEETGRRSPMFRTMLHCVSIFAEHGDLPLPEER